VQDLPMRVAAAAAVVLLFALHAQADPSAQEERGSIAAWRAARASALTSDDGWLSLVGLYWLKEGDNRFGRARGNELYLDDRRLPPVACRFIRHGERVRVVAPAGSGITSDGRPVTALDLRSDGEGEPTTLNLGSLEFHVIARGGALGLRVRDRDHPARRAFRGLEYFPVDPSWAIAARFEPYETGHRIAIVNVLGMELAMDSPGAIVFTREGREWRLDTVLEAPDDDALFIMFADATSGRETYGAGRFLYVPLPVDGRVLVDFNKAYNPPCALTAFATCPLPPPQNKLELAITAGELRYVAPPGSD